MGYTRLKKRNASTVPAPAVGSGYGHFFVDENDVPRIKDENGVVKDFTSGIIGINGDAGNIEIFNNEGKIKVNWTDPNLPNSGSDGFITNVVKQIPLNGLYTLSAVTKYPKLANPAIGGDNMIDPSTFFLREILDGQDTLIRVNARYRNKGSGQNAAIGLTLYNPNPASSFTRTLYFPTPDNITSITQEFIFNATADSVSLNPAYGYAFEAFTTSSDGNLIVEILDIKLEYIGTELIINVL